jgi:hypothetical protein
MARIQTPVGWHVVVDESARAFVDDLVRSGFLKPAATDESRDILRLRVATFALALLAGAASATAAAKCNDGRTVEDCDYFLRPNEDPYFRCRHAPPHCYRSDGTTMPQCP